jgi:hypothetical protein
MTHNKAELRKRIDEFCEEKWPDEGILLFGGVDGDAYDEGFIGIGFQHHKGPVAVYDREKCIEALAKEFIENADEDSDPVADAVEWFDFNTAGSWVGKQIAIKPYLCSTFPELTEGLHCAIMAPAGWHRRPAIRVATNADRERETCRSQETDTQ